LIIDRLPPLIFNLIITMDDSLLFIPANNR
jgi:hypothetical protein